MVADRKDAHVCARLLSLSWGVHRALFARCARAVRKVGYFRPIFPDGQGDTGLLRFLFSPKTRILR